MRKNYFEHPDRLKYCDLNAREIQEQFKAVENDPTLTVDQKIIEFSLLAYSRVYDFIGADFYLTTGNWPIQRGQKILYQPIDPLLPTVVLTLF